MASRTYTGAAGAGGWSNPLNWSGGILPAAGDSVRFAEGLAATIGGRGIANGFMVLDDADLVFTGSVTAQGWGSGNGFMVCDGAAVTFAQGAALQDGGALRVGVNGIGAFTATGATIASARAVIGDTAIASGTVTIDGSQWTDAGDLQVGASGAGTLAVRHEGTVMVGGNVYLGAAAGGTGAASLSGGASVTVARAAFIGLDGAGGLTVGAGSMFQAGTLLRVASGSTLVLDGGSVAAEGVSPVSCATGISIMAGGAITGHGTVSTPADGQFHDNGLIEAQGGTMRIDASVVGLGAMKIDAGSTMEITGQLRLAGGVDFAGAGATLSLAHGAVVAAMLKGLAAGDHIVMAGIDSAVWNAAAQSLTLRDAGQYVAQVQIAGSYTQDSFSVAQADGLGVLSVT